MALLEGKQNVHLYVRFLAKLGAPLSSELLTTLLQSSVRFGFLVGKKEQDKNVELCEYG